MKTSIKWLMTVAALALSALPHEALAYTWSNFAGLPGGQGNVTGTTTAARFRYPVSCAIDSANNGYSVDTTTQIRQTTAAGVVTVFADLATVASLPGQTVPNSQAELSCITCDAATGNLYATDRNLHVIWKITSAGVASIFAGAPPTTSGPGNGGYLDGAPATALFNTPQGLAFSSGLLWVSDTENELIRAISVFLGTATSVGTAAGTLGVTGSTDGPGASATFDHPTGITVAGSNVYVADSLNYTIRKVDASANVTTFAGTAGLNGRADGTGAAARFNFTFAGTDQMGTDAAGTSVYVTDGLNNNVRKIIVATRVVSTWLGSTTAVAGIVDGTGNAALFNTPRGIAFGSTLAYVIDSNNSTLRKAVVATRVVTTLAGSPPHPGNVNGTGAAARFNVPTGIAVSTGGIAYAIDNNGIRKITAAGVVTTLIPLSNAFFTAHGAPLALTVDISGNIIACGTSEIYSITPAGVPSVLASGFSWAYSITTYPGVIIVYDLGTNTMYKSTSGGAFVPLTISGVSIVGSATVGSQNSGGPIYLATGGKLYSFSATGPATATFIAGGGAYGDGTGSGAGFGPYLGANGITANSSIVYWADNASGTIRQIDPATGIVTTLGGSLHQWGGVGGVGTASRFGAPCGIAVSSTGIIYATDYGLAGYYDQQTGNNHNIWKGL